MTNIKIIFFDIDQTLMLTKEQHIPNGVKESFLILKKKGIKIAIATGRAYINFSSSILKLIEEVGIDIFVTINGSHVLIDNEIIYQDSIDSKDVKDISLFFNKYNINHGFVSHNLVTVNNNSLEVKESLGVISHEYIVDPKVYEKISIPQMVAFYSKEQDKIVLEKSILKDPKFKIIRWGNTGVDIVKKDTSKAFGVKKVLDFLNIDLKDAMAFGDALNDIEMLECVGLSVCMGNGYDELKEVADYVTSDIEDNGIINALKHFNLID
ncbi:MAG: Cof-type HAD-IIB family hydrolase [Psittacicella sp.]